MHDSCRTCSCPRSREGPSTQQPRAGQAEAHSSFSAGEAQQLCQRPCALGQPAFPKCLPCRARTRAVCAAATPLQSLGTNPSCVPSGNKEMLQGAVGASKDRQGTQRVVLKVSLFAGFPPPQNLETITFQQEMRKQLRSERSGSAAPPLLMGPRLDGCSEKHTAARSPQSSLSKQDTPSHHASRKSMAGTKWERHHSRSPGVSTALLISSFQGWSEAENTWGLVLRGCGGERDSRAGLALHQQCDCSRLWVGAGLGKAPASQQHRQTEPSLWLRGVAQVLLA